MEKPLLSLILSDDPKIGMPLSDAMKEVHGRLSTQVKKLEDQVDLLGVIIATLCLPQNRKSGENDPQFILKELFQIADYWEHKYKFLRKQ